MKNVIVKILSGTLALLMMTAALTSCNQTGDSNDDGTGTSGVTVQFWAAVNDQNLKSYQKLVNEFNSQNKYNIQVNLVKKSVGYSSNIGFTLQGKNTPDVVEIDDKYIKTYAVDNVLTPLDKYLANTSLETKDKDGNALLNIKNFWPNTVERFRYDAQNYMVSNTAPLYGIPDGNNPSILFYNQSYFDDSGINTISVAEDKLATYNKEQGSSYLPHGYYEYTTNPDPKGNLKKSGGVYRVFDNQISMSFEETVQLGKLFTKSYNPSSPSTYGFFTEWWFSHGWSVGGDCVEWDNSKHQYVFTLGDRQTNYLVTGSAGLTVNGTHYNAGQILDYNDKVYVNGNAAFKSANVNIAKAEASDKKLYPLPSQYDAFKEFCKLAYPKNEYLDSADKASGQGGYAISPNPNTINQIGKAMYFTSGSVAMLSDTMDTSSEIRQDMTDSKWDVAPLTQYREYNSDGTVKTVNGTLVEGKRSAHNYSTAYAIPMNSKNKDAAWRFIQFMTSQGAQVEIANQTGELVPNQMSYAESSAYQSQSFLPKNKAALVAAAGYSTVGDWSYLEDGGWINPWADVLNGPVRNGQLTLDQFFAQVTDNTNNTLKKYRSKKFQ